MYSQCPECLTRFRVTAAALRAARGTVRCGRCGSAFDALPRLSDTLQDAGLDSGPAQPAAHLLGTTGLGAATAAGLLTSNGQVDVHEFQLTADDIENVFIDVRDWQTQFGEAPAAQSTESKVWVHEPESVEDITLEGERIQIEGFAGFEEDFLEREIEKELEEQRRAEITGSQRKLADVTTDAGDVIVDDAVPMQDIEPLHDLDSTDQFEILTDLPEQADAANEEIIAPRDDDDRDDEFLARDELVAPGLRAADAGDAADASPSGRQIVPALPEAVATAAAGLASAAALAPAAPGDAVEGARLPPPRPAAPWRRVAEAAAEEAASAEDHEPDPQLAEDLAAAAHARTMNWAWGIGALLLVVALAAQLIHHNRLELARDPNVGPYLRDAYERIGQPLPPNSNLGAFELRQWGANESSPSAAGAMTVRASIRNGATFAQPMPLLRLELEDRFGGTVARRDFTAREYLKDPAQANRLLAAGTATEAELAVVDAPADAVGYRLDVCLSEPAAGVRCAQGGSGSPAAPGPSVQ